MDRSYLEKLTLKKLKEMVKETIGKGFSTLKKDELIDLLIPEPDPEPEPEPEPAPKPKCIPKDTLLYCRLLEKEKVKNKC